MATTETLYGSCPPDETINPKGYFNRNRVTDFRFGQPKNPVAAQIEDGAELKRFFQHYRDVYVPYAGTNEYTSHALRAFLASLSELSPTKNACINKIESFCFGGKVSLIRRLDPVYELEGEGEELVNAEKQAFYSFLKSISVFAADGGAISFRRMAKSNFRDLKGVGEYFIELQKSSLGGFPRFSAIIRKPYHCMYLATALGEDRWVAISPYLNLDYLNRNAPDMVPAYPNWIDEGGIMRSMVHVKQGDGFWYGRPDDIGSMMDQYYEFQVADYKSKQTRSAFTGQAFIEVEDDNPEYAMGDSSAANAGFDGLANQFEQNFTNKSEDPQSVILSTRPYGSKEAFVFQFSPNTNEQWYQVTEDRAEANIIKANQISRRLLGMDVSAGMNVDAWMSEFEIWSATVGNAYQEFVAEAVNNIILYEAAAHFGREDMLQYSLKFNNPFSEMLKQRRDANNDNNSGGGSEV